MNIDVRQFIDSGILESYVMGDATPAESREVLYMKKHYPEVQQSLNQIEHDLEALADRMAVPPPPDLWNRIESEMNEVVPVPQRAPLIRKRKYRQSYQQKQHSTNPGYIEVEARDSYMRIHKVWRWVFAAVFILGKIFLGFAIYFYLENRQSEQNIQELKKEVKHLQAIQAHLP